MKLHKIETGNFKLDGGAMFGVVPKSIWSKSYPADNNNMCSWAMRCLLIEDGERLILIDTGIGNKQSEKFFSYYDLFGNDSLEKSIKEAGFDKSEITDVILTHLHFDHCGGAVYYNNTKEQYLPTFPNATYWSNSNHWKWATEPNHREKASFLKENILPIEQSGQLKMIERNENQKYVKSPFENIEFLFVDGHTDSQMIPIIKINNKTIVYSADLLPSSAHIPIPYVMSYDTRPLLSMNEKKEFLEDVVNNNWLLYFEHDIYNEMCTLQKTDKGIIIDKIMKLSEIS